MTTATSLEGFSENMTTLPNSSEPTILPNFGAATFEPGVPIDNPYFPLKPGTIYVYEGESSDAEAGEVDRETDRVAVTFEPKEVAGVDATVVRDTVWANRFLEEDTRDWYAQDTDGNVWYLGEDTTEYEYDDEGNFIGTNNEGAWEAGVNGAQAGYIMEANPQVGDAYFQEFAPGDEAVDQAEVVSLDTTISTRLGNYSNVLQTLEFTALEPGVSEFKYYVPNIGPVLFEEGLDENLEPEFVFELASLTSVTSDAFTDGRGTEGNDALDGDNSRNRLEGGQRDDLLRGLGGKDWLTGQGGNDFLVGGNGLDVLKGGNGQDILIGGKEADTLKGGKGRDQFIFRTLEQKGDVIKDFTRQDVIGLAEIFGSENYGSSNLVDDYLQIKQVGSSTVVRIDPDGDTGSNPFEVLTTLNNTNVSILNDANFVV